LSEHKRLFLGTYWDSSDHINRITAGYGHEFGNKRRDCNEVKKYSEEFEKIPVKPQTAWLMERSEAG
jgi:hypothetical protein